MSNKTTYEITLSRPLLAVCWAIAIALFFNAFPNSLVPSAMAQLSSNPTITLVLAETGNAVRNLDIDD